MKSAATISIRLLNKSDVEHYRRLRLEALRLAPAAFGSSYAEEKIKPTSAFVKRLASKEIQNFGTFAKGRLVGILSLGRDPRRKRAHSGALMGMYVSTRWQRQGIGGALLDHVISEAQSQKGIRYLKLSVTSGNKAARSLYASRGFQTFGLEPEALLVGDRYFDEESMVLRMDHQIKISK